MYYEPSDLSLIWLKLTHIIMLVIRKVSGKIIEQIFIFKPEHENMITANAAVKKMQITLTIPVMKIVLP